MHPTPGRVNVEAPVRRSAGWNLRMVVAGRGGSLVTVAQRLFNFRSQTTQRGDTT